MSQEYSVLQPHYNPFLNFWFKQIYLKKTNEKLRHASDLVVFADKKTSVARKEMMDIFLSCYDEEDQEFMIKYLALRKIPSTKSAVLLDTLIKLLKEWETGPQKLDFVA